MDPAGYRQYVAICSRKGRKPDALIAKFAARYRFAGQLQSIEIHQLSPGNRDAYLEVLRLSLAYSAFEILVKVRDLQGSASLKSLDLAETYRSARLSEFHFFLLDSTRGNALQRQLDGLHQSQHDSNVLPVVAATRHLMFHGLLNPSAAGLGSKSARAFLELLTFALFREMDQQMMAHLSEFRAQL